MGTFAVAAFAVGAFPVGVTLDDVRHVAALAKVGVDESRLPGLARELSSILEHMSVLSRVDTQVVRDGGEVAGTPWRTDHGPPIALERDLAAFAPEVKDGFLILPRLATHVTAEAGGAVELDGHA